MSDFDKEAEREKLREKYGEEDEKRKATEQMSELLLKGATMTNAHCTDCGDPIFRYDGQEFCPTCQKPVAREQADGEAADDEQGDHIEVADPSDDATVQFGDDDAQAGSADAANGAPDDPSAPTDAVARESDPSAPADGDRRIPSADPDRTPGESPPSTDAVATASDPSTDPTSESPDRSPATTRRRDGTGDDVAAELSAAESLLAETVHRFARRAADTDDPRRARDQLAAAREAAEALDAVRF